MTEQTNFKKLTDLYNKLHEKCKLHKENHTDKDILYDIRAHLKGLPTILRGTTETYIKMVERRLW